METKQTPTLITGKQLSRCLPRGSKKKIAAFLGVSTETVRVAIQEMKPNNKAVQMALQIAKECGAFETASQIAELSKVLNPENKAA